MTNMLRVALGAVGLLFGQAVLAADDPLPSWNDTAAKERIVNFVTAVTDPAGKDFVRPAERIAVFDNDGTLWIEKPAYFQLLFAIDRVKAARPPRVLTSTSKPGAFEQCPLYPRKRTFSGAVFMFAKCQKRT